LSLNGLGLRRATFLKVRVYVAALYTTTALSEPNSILTSRTPDELILEFVRDVSVDNIRSTWKEGFEKNAKAQSPAL
jgi:hypothetical protein